MSFNEWRHQHTSYDNRMRGARSLDQQRKIQEEIAMEAMQIAVQKHDQQLAQSVMGWARSKRLITEGV
jgi:hypothetical protein